MIAFLKKLFFKIILINNIGRERIFHGVNAVVKGPPWIPDNSKFDPEISLCKEDYELISGLGLNIIRLGTMWPGVEPDKG